MFGSGASRRRWRDLRLRLMLSSQPGARAAGSGPAKYENWGKNDRLFATPLANNSFFKFSFRFFNAPCMSFDYPKQARFVLEISGPKQSIPKKPNQPNPFPNTCFSHARVLSACHFQSSTSSSCFIVYYSRPYNQQYSRRHRDLD